MARTITLLLLLLVLVACKSTKFPVPAKKVDQRFTMDVFKNHFSGFILVDPQTKDTIYEHNSEKYFTPASNTKIVTLYTALKILPDKIPALTYMVKGDTLFVEGTGDPSLLHPYFQDSTAIHFLRDHAHIKLNPHNFQEEVFGPGWAWDDYQYKYSAERSALPLYGNVVTLFQNDSLEVLPQYFKSKVVRENHPFQRDRDTNLFYMDPQRKDTLQVPFKTNASLTQKLLEHALHKKVFLTDQIPPGKKETLYGLPADSLYKRMMHKSDNFLAEQLLLLASSALTDTLNGKKVRDYVMDQFLNDIKQPPRWVDGSGLSRYNLFTPQSLLHVLHNIYSDISKERLFMLFPEWHAQDIAALGNTKKHVRIYAKSGSLSNNYCLSGYLLTRSNKLLIFSFMNNHFTTSTDVIKREIETVLILIGNTY